MTDIQFDPAKRLSNLAKHGLDFLDAPEVFAGRVLTIPDPRVRFEDRYLTLGLLGTRRVVIVWTPRQDARRIISMRFAHVSEARRWLDDEPAG